MAGEKIRSALPVPLVDGAVVRLGAWTAITVGTEITVGTDQSR